MEIEKKKICYDDYGERKIISILHNCITKDEHSWYWYCRFNHILYKCNSRENGYQGSREVKVITNTSSIPISDFVIIKELDINYENYIWIPEIGVINIDTGRRIGANKGQTIGSEYFECAKSLKALFTTNLTQPKERRKSWR